MDRHASGIPEKVNIPRVGLHWAHWLIIALSLALTLFAWRFSSAQLEEKSQVKFMQESTQIISLIEERMAHYEDALRGGAAYIAAVDNVFYPQDWVEYSEHLSIEEKYPGINGIGVIYGIPLASLKDFEAAQQEARPFFSIYPEHDNAMALPITYIEPLRSNKKALGLDVAHESNRLTAAEKSIATGNPQITGPIVLVQDNEKTPGFLFYVPFYIDETSGKVSENPSDKFLGFVYAPFIFKKLMGGLLSEENRLVQLKISDMGEVLYNEHPSSYSSSYSPLHSTQILLPFYGRQWQFDIITIPGFNRNVDDHQPTLILMSGITIDILLFFIFFTLSNANRRAIKYAQEVTHAIEQKTHEYEELAHFDFLTGLPNRMSFLGMLDRLISRANDSHSGLAVCFIDIDDFKFINDSLGHDVGDKMLVGLVELLKPAIDGKCYFARLGGDEFGLLIENANNIDRLHVILKRCLYAATQSIRVNSHEVHTTISIGIAVYPDAGKEASELIAHADIAMYRAKSLGKGNFEFFNEEMSILVKQRQAIDSAMRQAISKNEFCLYYQPQIDIKTKRPIGLEALIRWHNPELGHIPPDQFIGLAEENGYINDIGAWVLARALSDFKIIREKTNLTLNLSINVSAKELERPGYANRVKNIVPKSGLPAEEISLELTESGLMSNIAKSQQIMREIQELGLCFALDDFGTGYSSMQYLKTLPISSLKVDKVFVDDLPQDSEDAIVVKATIQLAHGLGIKVIAEGVETKEQLAFLEEHACDQAQGFLFCKPKSCEDIIDWLNENKQDASDHK